MKACIGCLVRGLWRDRNVDQRAAPFANAESRLMRHGAGPSRVYNISRQASRKNIHMSMY